MIAIGSVDAKIYVYIHRVEGKRGIFPFSFVFTEYILHNLSHSSAFKAKKQNTPLHALNFKQS